MSTSGPNTPLSDSYAAIEDLLLDSRSGRTFLEEYTRRHRAADTRVLLDAIAKLQDMLNRPAPAPTPEPDRLQRELIAMSQAIAETRREIAAIKPPGNGDSDIMSATGQLGAIVAATEHATGDILSAAEALQESSIEFRQKGMKARYCDRLDALAAAIFTACSFQDITGQRTDKVVQLLHLLEDRVNAMIGIWGGNAIALNDAGDGQNSACASPHDYPEMEPALQQEAIDSVLIGNRLSENDDAWLDDVLFQKAPDVAAEPPISSLPAAEARPSSTTPPKSPDVVDEDMFGQPEDLSLWSLDTVKKTALFG